MSRERAELSKKNPYHIPRYRYYELKYFCRQYDDWKKALTLIDGWQTSPNDISGIIKGCPPESPTERIALSRVFYSSCILTRTRCRGIPIFWFCMVPPGQHSKASAQQMHLIVRIRIIMSVR